MAQEQLQTLLETLLEHDEVHFQPPTSTEIDYSNGAIVYQLDTAETEFADDIPYRRSRRYQVTLITRTPDETVCEKVAALPTCTGPRWFAKDNLNHYVFDLYF